ncbi:MAG: type II toxin-antitoxin system VapC family toxin [Candidatus Omnitrophica bacterium]|nr:type II toxin-antitoxin system VapC family toxin [Candidatus Omnitrophota bacterium]
MKSARLLDSFALIKFLREEPGFDRIRHWFVEARQRQESLLICELNVGEVFYVIGRERGLPKAEEILGLLPMLPLKTLAVTWEMILQAARLKAQYPLSYADCIAAACAMSHQAVLVTGDSEFKALKHLLPIEWI